MGRATLRGALSPSLRPRQKRGFEDHTESYQQGWNQGPRRRRRPALRAFHSAARNELASRPSGCRLGFAPDAPCDTGSQALPRPTWRAESESQGRVQAAVCGHSGSGGERRRLDTLEGPRKDEGRAESLPSARSQPLSLSSLASWLRFINPVSESSLAPRHSGDATSGLRLPWEPRPGQGARRTTSGAGRWALGLRCAPRAAFGVSERHLSPAARGRDGAARVVFFFFF